jgi:hypothetical protein
MTQSTELTTKTGATELTPSTQDVKSWSRVQLVLSALDKEKCNTLTKACEKAGVPRETFYRDLRRPYVAQMWLDHARSRKAVLHEVLDRSLPLVAMNMANIASGEKSREAVQAARWLYDVLKDLDKDALESEEGDGDLGEAASFLAQFGKARYTARRKRKTRKGEITEEIEVLSRGKRDDDGE